MLKRLKWASITLALALAPVLTTDEPAHAQRAQAVYVQQGLASWYGPGFNGQRSEVRPARTDRRTQEAAARHQGYRNESQERQDGRGRDQRPRTVCRWTHSRSVQGGRGPARHEACRHGAGPPRGYATGRARPVQLSRAAGSTDFQGSARLGEARQVHSELGGGLAGIHRLAEYALDEADVGRVPLVAMHLDRRESARQTGLCLAGDPQADTAREGPRRSHYRLVGRRDRLDRRERHLPAVAGALPGGGPRGAVGERHSEDKIRRVVADGGDAAASLLLSELENAAFVSRQIPHQRLTEHFGTLRNPRSAENLRRLQVGDVGRRHGRLPTLRQRHPVLPGHAGPERVESAQIIPTTPQQRRGEPGDGGEP